MSGASSPSSLLDVGVEVIPGIGRRTAEKLREDLGIVSVRDLVEHYPRRYEDLGERVTLSRARPGQPATIIATVAQWEQKRARGRRLRISEAEVRDTERGRFTITFFNQPWMERRLPPGTTAAFSGVLEHRYGALRMSTPQVLELGADHRRLVPVYPATESLTSARLESWIRAALAELPPFEDHLPDELRRRHRLVPLDRAMRAIHEPQDEADARGARERLVFDELFTLQVGLQWRRSRLERDAVGFDNAPVVDGLPHRFLRGLDITPTRAQRDAFVEIAADLAADRPMHRLLQGDVGSGKTLVATWTMLCAVARGRQAALMVPTEVLAEQHHRTLLDQLAPLGVNVLDGVRVELLTSSTTTSERRRILAEMLSGDVDVVVGTHALLEEGVRFHELGVVVVDEQHRFGVSQRVKLREKGRADGRPRTGDPDVLVMTATPIPRSLALTMYGDLDVTTLDEVPPGRQPIVTQLITPAERHRRDKLYGFVREQANAGYQTYVVCPLIEPSTEIAARSASEEHGRLRDEVFPDLNVGLVHGRLRPDDKEAVMAAFRRGELDVLVATTVIEVGVDVPRATVMIIEDAERFGISQLHQLRGRVGRGPARSYCVLFAGWSSDELTEDAIARLEAVRATTDGFQLAETDLELRGEGQLFGVRQSGLPDLKLARLTEDRDQVEATRTAALELVMEHPELDAPGLAALRAEVRRRYRGGLEELEALTTG